MISYFKSIKLKKNHNFKDNYKHSFVYRLKFSYRTSPLNSIVIKYYSKNTRKHYYLFVVEQITDDIVQVTNSTIYEYNDELCVYFCSIKQAKSYILKNIDYTIKRIEYSFLI